MAGLIQVVTTTAERNDAERIATALVEERLAACVQIVGPVASTYRWQGRVEQAQEWLCVAKTSQDHYAAVEAAITRLHPYDVPEIVATAIDAGSASYFEWLQGELRPTGEQDSPNGDDESCE